jgi:GntR family transcriptional regulator, transcriptional repressor for pyruvate dehydrogenase complex
MQAAAGPLRRRPLVDEVIAHLEGAISAGRFALGARLPSEAQLMSELGVGRSTLREAVRVLAHNGLLEVRQGDGTYVRAVTSAEPLARRLSRSRIAEVHEVRRALELETARLAALRRSEHDLVAMRSHLTARGAALARGDHTAALDADIAFHCAVAAAAANAVLAELYQTFAASLRPALAELWQVEGNPAEAADLHDQLFAAIAAHDADSAVNVTSTLLTRHSAALSDQEGG